MPAAPRFPIEIRFRGGLSTSQQDAFAAAAARWQRVIVQPLPIVAIGTLRTRGIIIDAQGSAIDGPSGILGQAGPTRLRPAIPSMGEAAFLPCMGVMSFDTADLAKMEGDGTLVDVITHEMGHVLGIGTVWTRKQRLVGRGTQQPRFIGPAAVDGYRTLTGRPETAVPVEATGGPGTRDSHWSERVFGTELMTGYVSPAGARNPISRVTVLSLRDLGYAVDPTAADPFGLSSVVDRAAAAPLVERPHCMPTIPFTHQG